VRGVQWVWRMKGELLRVYWGCNSGALGVYRGVQGCIRGVLGVYSGVLGVLSRLQDVTPLVCLTERPCETVTFGHLAACFYTFGMTRCGSR